jgi:GrpB-like predicted nucleotidyltransferase (UPF0157 family)
VKRQPPPPALGNSRVLAYAFVDDIPYRKAGGAIYYGDELVEHVPCLAICARFGADADLLLFHCDEDWRMRGLSGGGSVEAVKARAERNYPGVASRWVDVNVSQAEALAYYDEEFGDHQCSFCGKRSYEIDGLVSGSKAAICRGCVEDFYQGFKEKREEDPELSKPYAIVDYDPLWPARFEELATRIRAVLGDRIVSVEHVGSTAVPELAGKPVIDLDVVLASAEDHEPVMLKLVEIGYSVEGDLGARAQWAFRATGSEVPHYLYLVIEGESELKRHRAFRDELRSSPGLRDQYAALKRALAAQSPDDRSPYARGKSGFIRETLRSLEYRRPVT